LTRSNPIQIACTVSCLIALGFNACLRADDEQPIKLALHPMAAPTPALKYRLLPGATELTSGNAAVPYGKVTAEQWTFFPKYANTDIINTWQTMPLDKLRQTKIEIPEASVFFLEQGAKCKYCDWQLPFGQIPFYSILLPGEQQTRSYARILAVKARVEIANGKFDDAVKSFQTSFALSANVAKGETLVNGLIGIAINSVTFPQMCEYVQQPGAPNLYWALTVLPSPRIDMRPALDIESNSIELSFPELRDLSSIEQSSDEWRSLFQRFVHQVADVTQSQRNELHVPSPEEIDAACKKIFPIAKLALIERGTPAAKVEAMSVYQAGLLYWLQLHHELVDGYTKVYSMPYPQAIEGFRVASERAQQAKMEGRELIPLASTLEPVMEATRTSVVKDDRRIAILRVFEALRLYAATHDSKLANKLSDINEVPVPDDPVTTKPFEYRCEGDKAFIQSPKVGDDSFQYEITMAAAK
jgi:hypothetical protein